MPALGLTVAIRKDALRTLRRLAREYGDIICIPIAFQNRIFLNHPDYIEQVLVRRPSVTRFVTYWAVSHRFRGVYLRSNV